MKVLSQLETAGYLHLLQDVSMVGNGVHFFMPEPVREMLADDPRFMQDYGYHLHIDDVGGEPCCGRRSITGLIGRGSIQVVWNTESGRGFADVDHWNLQDVVNILGHTFGEVVPNFFKRLFGKKPKAKKNDKECP